MDVNFIQKAKVFAELKKWKVLESFCEEKLESDPEEKYAIYYLALSYHARGKNNLAAELIQPYIAYTNDFKSLFADIKLELKDYILAQELYLDLLSQQPEDDFNLAKIAKTKLALLDYTEARDYALRSLGINPRNSEAIQILSLTSLYVDSQDSKLLSNYLENDPNNPTLIVEHVKSLILQGNIETAFELASNALSRNPNNELLIDCVIDTLLNKNSVYNRLEIITDKDLEKYLKKKTLILIVALFIMLRIFLSQIGINDYYFFIILYFFLMLTSLLVYKEPIGIILISRHNFGKNLLSKQIKRILPILKLLFLSAILIITYSFFTKNVLALRLGFLSFFSTLPVLGIADMDGELRKDSTITFLVIVLISVLFMVAEIELIILITYILLICFNAIIYLLFMLSIYEDKENAKKNSSKIQ